MIFSNKQSKEILDKLTLKFVVPKIKTKIRELIKLDIKVVLDAPLLFEMGLDIICDVTIGVIASQEVCIKRIGARDSISEISAKARLNNQKTNEFFKIKCDYVIKNEGDMEGIEEALEDIFNRQKFI